MSIKNKEIRVVGRYTFINAIEICLISKVIPCFTMYIKLFVVTTSIYIFNSSLAINFSKILVTTGYSRWKELNNTEIVDLSRNCSVPLPDYPKRLTGTTGKFLDDAAIICGGRNNGPYDFYYTSECFALTKNFKEFESIAPMKEERAHAKSIITQGQIWVTGGHGNKIHSSTDYIPKKFSSNEPILPEPVERHAIISINDTTSMLIGGYTTYNFYSRKTYYFNHHSQIWNDGPSLMNGRCYHTAGLIMDHVTHTQHIAVVGGYNNEVLDSVELLLNGETQWKKGI